MRGHRVDWVSLLDDSTLNQSVLVRLKVWNSGEEGRALFDHLFYNYQAN